MRRSSYTVRAEGVQCRVCGYKCLLRACPLGCAACVRWPRPSSHALMEMR
jgi:hypothetical protein